MSKNTHEAVSLDSQELSNQGVPHYRRIGHWGKVLLTTIRYMGKIYFYVVKDTHILFHVIQSFNRDLYYQIFSENTIIGCKIFHT